MLKRWAYRWVIGIVAIAITIAIMHALPKGWQIKWDSVWGMVIFVPVLAVVNAIIGTVLRVLAIPINCLTLGLFSFVVNAVVFWIAGAATDARTGLGIPMGFMAALIGSILYTLISAPLSLLVREKQ